ncbi:hypothetical protein [Flavobacterium sp.]|uniref:hypothetical protein n=1 Tax=Flavobacterium sp. TaxID=239 RepID=UPI0038FC0B84
MFKKINYLNCVLLLLLSSPIFVTAQVGIGNTNPQGALDITTDTATNPTNADGLLIPRVALSATTIETVITPTESEMVYNIATINDVTPGYYYWNATKWIRLTTSEEKDKWSLTGNLATNPTVNFIGTIDATDFVTRTNNLERMRILSNGNVGIGIGIPDANMDVLGTIKSTLNYGNFRTYNWTPGGDSSILLGGFNGTGGYKPQMRWTYNTTSNFFDEGLNGNGNFAIQVNDIDGLVLDTNRNIGIGTSIPTEKLEVNGKTKTTSFQMTNGAAAGYVLQSDASGNASWTSPLLNTYSATSIIASPLTQNVTGSLIYSQNSGFPVFPENLPDGFTCTIVNYSIFPNVSNTLTTAKFITTTTGMSGASSFIMAPGETVNVYVITNTATLEKNYFIK